MTGGEIPQQTGNNQGYLMTGAILQQTGNNQGYLVAGGATPLACR